MNCATTLLARKPGQEAGFGVAAGLGIIDCDIHPYPKSATALYPYLSLRWRQHIAAYGGSLHWPARQHRRLSAVFAEHLAPGCLAARLRAAGLRSRFHTSTHSCPVR